MEDASGLDNKKLCTVQCYEIPDHQKLAVERIGKALCCVGLRWQRALGKLEILSAG